MTNIEQLVRPFQTRDTQPRPRNLSFNVTNNLPEGAQVLISGSGGKIFQYSFDFSSNFTETQTTTFREQRRVEETLRVTNPDDASQFVDVKQALSVDMQSDPNQKGGIDDRFTGTPGGIEGVDQRRSGIGERIKLMYNNVNKKKIVNN